MEYYELTNENINKYINDCTFFKNIDKTEVEVTNISNGINNVFLIVFNNKNKPLILKQAMPFFRQYRDEEISQNRLDCEYETYNIFSKNTKELLPKLHYYSNLMKVIIIDYLYDCIPLTMGLNKKIIFPNLAKDIARFLSNNHFKTSSFFLDSKKKRELLTLYNNNSDLCELSEKYIFTDRVPLNLFNKNKGIQNKFHSDLFLSDAELQKNILELKYKFMNKSDCLIHSDFYSGSIMLDLEKTFVIDFEFSFMGPFAYDLATFLYTITASIISFSLYSFNEEYIDWLNSVINSTYEYYEQYFDDLWTLESNSALISTKTTNTTVFNNYKKSVFKEIIQDSIGFAGVQMSAMLIPLLNLEENNFEEKEDIYFKKMFFISKTFLKNYKSISDITQVLKIIKSI